MGNLKRDYNRFVNRNRNKGIPRLMLWICAGNAVVFLMQYLFDSKIASYLYFNSALILRGQVWRLFSYIFTFASQASFLGLPILGAVISIMFYYWIGNTLENVWGTLRFNLYYLCGILLADIYCLLLTLLFDMAFGLDSHALNLSMFLAVATLIPEQKVYVYMILPIKMKWLAWLDLGLVLYDLVHNLVDFSEIWAFLPPYYVFGTVLISLVPLISILNYFLFFGRGIKNLLPDFLRNRGTYRERKRRAEYRRKSQPDFRQQPSPNWAQNYRSSTGERPYRHKCTVCGRTDTDCPDLEFRYCSRCSGYFCYCIDHIDNHTHVQ